MVGGWKAVGCAIALRIEAGTPLVDCAGVLRRQLEAEASQIRVAVVLGPVTDQGRADARPVMVRAVTTCQTQISLRMVILYATMLACGYAPFGRSGWSACGRAAR